MTPPTNDRPEACDDVIEEVRRIKAELLARHGFDLAAMIRDARARQGETVHSVVSRAPVRKD